jgi:caa(3)-type oxidase subunit IV
LKDPLRRGGPPLATQRRETDMAYYFDHKHVREDQPAAHVDSLATIYMVWLAIFVGAILTIAVSFAGLGGKAIFVHMFISAVQVSLLAYYWMHLYRADAVTWLTALSGLFIMVILFSLPLSDYLTRHLGGL